jgi:hypothetical protein
VNVVTFEDGTYIKLGFLVKGLTSATPYVNGVAKTASKITANISGAVEMVPSLACFSEATTDPLVDIDWIQVIQREQIAN